MPQTDSRPAAQAPAQASGERAHRTALFRRIYDAEVATVWTCLRRLGVLDRDLEDKVHDVFVVFYRRLDAFDPERSARAWLAGIAVKVAADYRRRAGFQREELLDNAHQAQAADPDPEMRAATRESQQLVLRALDALPEERRAVFVLHELDGHPIPALSELLEVPLNTLYSRLRLAREEFTRAVRRLQPDGGAR